VNGFMKRKLFTQDQLKRFANIFDNLGQVVIASIVLPFLVNADKVRVDLVLLGSIAALSVWWTSLRIERISS